METNKFVYCVQESNNNIAIYNNINYAMKHLLFHNKCVIKPYLLNSILDFEIISYNPHTSNFYNSKQFFYIDHQYINSENTKDTKDTKDSDIKYDDQQFTEGNLDNVDDQSLNLFIPLGKDDEETYFEIKKKEETDMNNMKLSKIELLEKLRHKINNLKNLKEIEENDLTKIKTMMENKKDNFNKNRNKFNKIKKQKNEKKEQYECLKRKFESDINTYYKMKEDINNNILKEIPELFKLKYDILTVMDNNEELNKPNSLENYLVKIPYIQEVYTIEDEQLFGIFGEYYLKEDHDSSNETSNDELDSTDYDTEDN
jgi:hypothetical protein